jgi:hypothetical protein
MCSLSVVEEAGERVTVLAPTLAAEVAREGMSLQQAIFLMLEHKA